MESVLFGGRTCLQKDGSGVELHAAPAFTGVAGESSERHAEKKRMKMKVKKGRLVVNFEDIVFFEVR